MLAALTLNIEQVGGSKKVPRIFCMTPNCSIFLQANLPHVASHAVVPKLFWFADHLEKFGGP